MSRWVAGGSSAPSGMVASRTYANGTWPVRGTLPAGTVVLWLHGTTDPEPPVGGGYYQTGDLVAVVSS